MNRVNKFALGGDVQRAISEIKSEIQRGGSTVRNLEPFEGREFGLSLLPGQGGKLYEYKVGQAHQADPRQKGSRRLVVHIESGRIQHLYFTEDHYKPGSWVEVTSW